MTSPLERWNHLDGKVVMVTGASSGIGKEFCINLAKAGCRIIAAARRIDRLQSLCQEINHMAESGGRAAAVEVALDVSGDGTVIEVAVRKAWETFGRIDALINSAGVRGTIKSPLELPEDEWDNTYRTNVRGSWLVTKYMCLQMCASNIRGSIINISSIGGTHRGQLLGAVAYDSSKAALNTMTKVIAIEFGSKGIRVNSISPGLFKSEITEGLMQKDWLQNVALRTCPLRAFGTSDPALTSLVRYLIDDSSEYVSGNIFIVDAGVTLPGVPIFSSL